MAMNSSADYRGLLALSPDGVIVVRSDCSILAVNAHLVALFGYSAADLEGVPLEFLLPSACDAIRQVQAAAQQVEPQSLARPEPLEYWVQNAEGSTLAVDVTLTAMHAQDTAQSLVCLSVRDATRRKKAEQALDEARIKSDRIQNDLLDLSNTLPLAIFQWESDDAGIGKYTFMSARVKELLGVSAEHILADPERLFAPLMDDDVRMLKEQMNAIRAKVRRGQDDAGFSLAVRARVLGKLQWLRMSTVYAGQRVDGRSIWNGYLEDITRRKQIEEEKELATFQFKTLWEKSPDSYIFLGPGGVLSCNAATLDLFGIASTAELMGHCISEPHFSPALQPNGQQSPVLFADIQAFATALAQDAEGQAAAPEGVPLRKVRGSIKIEWLLLRHGKQMFEAEIVVTPMQIDTHDGYLLICQDVSLQRQAQVELLNAKLAAEDTARTKADFLANMSHEIRTPMNAIVGLSHLVLQSELSRTQRDFVTKIQDSGQHLLGIINDILDFSKMEAGKLTVERRDFALSRVLDNVTNLIGEKARGKDLELLFDIDPQVPDCLNGDALRLGQILINYANNAIKFTHSGEICIAVVVLESQADQVTLRFEVRDTGIGLSAEQMDCLFQSFQQADTSTTRKYGGTGLGLAISKSLAELMQGSVGVESQLGRGSTFWFTAQLKKGREAPRTLQPEAGLRGRRVLVVDDNPSARLVMHRMLDHMTFEVDLLDAGNPAVEAVKRAADAHKPYEIVFLDWRLEDLDGIEVARQIQALNLPLPPGIVMVTAYGDGALSDSAANAGVDAVLVKPIKAWQLFDTAMRMLGAAVADAPPQPPHAGTSEAGLASIAGARVLLVEDNDLNQLVASELLRGAGLEVDIADNGRIAVDRILQSPSHWDLVMMDMQMPVLDGVAATREIRKALGVEWPVIVAMTANAMPQHREKCLEAGMQDFVTKPIEPEQLWRTLLRWIAPRKNAIAPRPRASQAPGAGMPLPRDIEGLDVDLGLRRILGKELSYIKMLRKFGSGQSDAVLRMRGALAQDDWLGAERVAHTLKGVAGNIGATLVQAQAEAMENALRERAAPYAIEQLAQAAEQSLNQLVAALQQSLPQLPSVTASDADLTRLEGVQAHLKNLLQTDDSAAIDVFSDNAELFKFAHPSRYQDIETALANFDFAKALEYL